MIFYCGKRHPIMCSVCKQTQFLMTRTQGVILARNLHVVAWAHSCACSGLGAERLGAPVRLQRAKR